jgi:hypothetical protein
MKNILAENLLRFGVKNLSEADKQKVQEQFKPGQTQETYEFVPLTIYVPGYKDQNGQWQFAKDSIAMVVAVNDTKSLERFTGITKLDFVGTATIPVKSTKNPNGDLSGKFTTFNQPALVKYLTSNAGKTLPSGDKSILVSLTNTSNATEPLPASKTSFVWYDPKAPRQVQPK